MTTMGMILKDDIFFKLRIILSILKNRLKYFNLVVALNFFFFFFLPLKGLCRNEVLESAEKGITWEKPALQT